MEALILRFDAPLMSFGGVAVDNNGVTARFPGRSMLTGLVANALGYRHGDANELQALQSRISFAARCDRPGARIVDYHTADLSQEFLRSGWTTRGSIEKREGGSASEGTAIRYRHYHANALYTLALGLSPQDAKPTVSDVEAALRAPARPLFLGRKACLPAAPILIGRHTGVTLRAILRAIPPVEHRSDPPPWPAVWPMDEDTESSSRLVPAYDDRDWFNQIHTGRRWMREGVIDV
ncbi:MAG: type I-E CRISPR-associated protein Cas5/CasD [Candidatus Binatia bacterium]